MDLLRIRNRRIIRSGYQRRAVSKTAKATSKVGVHKVKGAAQKIPPLNLYPYAPQHQLAGVNAGIVPYNTVNSVGLRDQLISMAKVKSIGSPKTRLPRRNGQWKGEPGNSKWYSEKPQVKKITNDEGIEFKEGRPNFTPWSKGSIKFKEGMLDGTKNDFNLVYEKIKQLKGFKSINQAKFWLKEKGLTPHHKSSTEIELIPTDLHGNIPHIGSASDLRGGNISE
ncbi:HNH endonuclease [Rummeliibacillus suwonensis]|uniref:HNH endonuclease n=1 Tax=Rummeliibacillus suwonensis TaxID=1306154 RepID=UPI001AAFB9D7|nr:HNH endonuclease [Rummeliibacillus suwonensis]MBO2535596.1 HNH endonuclease [Rummeliibacillus suwonensis]